MPYYRVRPGFKFGKHNEFLPGDVVLLTEEEFTGFSDKLELIEEKEALSEKEAELFIPEEDTPLISILPEKVAQKFIEAGVTSANQAKAMTDEELLGLPSIGAVSVKQLREALK